MKKHFSMLATCLVMGMGLIACHSGTSQLTGHNNTVIDAPLPEEEAMFWLWDVLMSPEGSALTAEQLAQLKWTDKTFGVMEPLNDDDTIRNINLPVNSEDVLPRMGKYENEETGATIVFKPYTNKKDTINPVCQADLRIAWHSWDEQCYLPEDTCETRCIQNRGRGILAIYHIVHDFGHRNGSHDCYEDHPDGYPEYWGALLYVYPDADSLIFTCGYEESKRVYRFVK